MTAPKSPKSDDTLIGTDIIPAQGEDELNMDLPEIQDPAEYKTATDGIREEYQRQAEENAKNIFSERETLLPQPVTGTIDVAKFLTAQAIFIKAQTAFMQRRRGRPGDSDPLQDLMEVTRFSYAQADFIEAQSEVLRQLGVI